MKCLRCGLPACSCTPDAEGYYAPLTDEERRVKSEREWAEMVANGTAPDEHEMLALSAQVDVALAKLDGTYKGAN